MCSSDLNVANYQVTVREMPDQIIFLHQVQPGGADKSYGIEAGRLAGLPPLVIDRARQVMTDIERHSAIAVTVEPNLPVRRRSSRSQAAPTDQMDLFA